MRRVPAFSSLPSWVLLCLIGGTAPAVAQNNAPATSRSTKIANALGAAPAEIARSAAVKDWPAGEGGEFTVLREGTNRWTCLPDDPTTRGNDPMCLDAVWMDALTAYFAGRAPQVTRVGYAYMLNSDAEGSNTDPMASAPTTENQWHHQGPHVMVLYPDPTLLEGLPTTPTEYGPYVMFAGTPIAHVMFPTRSGYAARQAGHGSAAAPASRAP